MAVLGDRPLAAAQQEAAQVALAARRRVERPRLAVGQERVAAAEVEREPEQRPVSEARRRLAVPLEAPAEKQALQSALLALRRLGPAMR